MDFYRIYKIIIANKIFWTFCALVLFVNLIIYISIIREQQDTIHELQKNYTELRKNWNPKSAKSDAVRMIENTKLGLKAFMDSLPAMANISDKARELSYILKKKDMNMGRITFKPERRDVISLWRYSTTISAIGSYESIKRVLADIQGSPSLFCIEHLSLMRIAEQNLVNMKLRVATYCR